jgi:thiosulfate reductase cytochrome b subunit
MGRRWHLFFAWVFVINGVLFAGYGWLGRHFRQDLIPRGRDLRGIGRVLGQHLTFRHAGGAEARHYNVLQKLAYSGVLFGLVPLVVLTGLSMSPAIDAAYPWLPALFGGRQSARTIHFLVCWAFVGFIGVHVLMVATTGLLKNIRSMITGWFWIHTEESHEA